MSADAGGRPVYEQDDAGVFMRAGYRPPHTFSDGAATEEYVRAAVLGAGDLSDGSDELAQLVLDWPSEYHFSPARSTLLAPFDFAGLDVLEVGAGCGALTRALGEAGARVTALEASPARAAISAARCRGLDDVRVVCDDFASFAPAQPADAVLLFGVLAYAPLYFSGSDPVGAALAHARACLAPGGAVIVAIENQLGLKYFAGCSEDHAGIPFFGIEDRYAEAGGAVTFGRGELRERLSAAGLPHQRFTYPFPDYKLPRLLLTEEALAEPRLQAGRLAGWAGTRDYLHAWSRQFSEAAAWEVVGRNGLIADFANSFLVAASSDPQSPLLGAPGWLVEFRTTDRIRAYRTITRIRERAGGLYTRKQALWPATPAPDLSPVALHVPIEDDYVRGRTLGARVRGLAQTDGATTQALADALRPWVALLRASAGEADGTGGALPPDALDLMPWNLMEVPSNEPGAAALVPFDQEWLSLRRSTLEHAVFRGLFHLLSWVRTVRPLTREGTVADLLTEVAGLLGLPLDWRSRDALVRREAEIQGAVSGLPFARALEALERQCDRPTVERPPEAQGDGGAAEATASAAQAQAMWTAAIQDLERRRRDLAGRTAAGRRATERERPLGATPGSSTGGRLTLARVRAGSRRKIRGFREATRAEGFGPAATAAARSVKASALYWSGKAPAARQDAQPSVAATSRPGPPDSWRPVPPSLRRVDVAVALAGATALEAEATLDGLLHQSHLTYDVVVNVDGCSDPGAVAAAHAAAAEDPRFSILAAADGGAAHEGGSVAPDRLATTRVRGLAAALESTTADLVLLLTGGDVVHGQTLAELARAVDLEPRATLVYADSGTLTRPGPHASIAWLPGDDFRKPDWSPTYLQSTPYVLGCVAIDRTLYREAGGLDPARGEAALYDLLLRAAEAGARGAHVGRVLVRREGAVPAGAPAAEDAGLAAVLQAAADRLQPPAAVEPGLVPGVWRLRQPDAARPPVTLVVLSADPVSEVDGRGEVRVLANLLVSVARDTEYPDSRLLVVDDGELSPASAALLEAAGGTRLSYDGRGDDPRGFNFSAKVNFALEHVQTEHFVLLNDDLEVLDPGWLSALMDYAVLPDVGAVGGHLLFADGRTQHAGVVAWPGGPGHAFYGQPQERRTRGGSPFVVRDYAAVTAAVLASDLTTYHTVGPFDELLAHDYQDVDWCLRAGRLGYRMVYTPHCRMYHFEHATLARTAPAAEDHALFMSRWADWCEHDPYYVGTWTMP